MSRSSSRSGLRYYSRFFAPEDIYVLDHGTTDGSTELGGFVRIPVEHETVDNAWMVETVQSEQRRLLERYDVRAHGRRRRDRDPDPAGERWANTSPDSTRISSTASATRSST